MFVVVQLLSCKSCVFSNGLITRLYKEDIQLNIQRKTNVIKAWAENLNILPKTINRWPA